MVMLFTLFDLEVLQYGTGESLDASCIPVLGLLPSNIATCNRVTTVGSKSAFCS